MHSSDWCLFPIQMEDDSPLPVSEYREASRLLDSKVSTARSHPPESGSAPLISYGTFRYRRRLQDEEIRLLKILKCDSQDTLRCTLLYCRLEDPVDYVALSYSWGFIDVTHPIECDGQSVLVSESVHSALQSLYHEGDLGAQGRPIWIDAICIYSHRSRIKYLRKLRFTASQK